MDTAFSIVNIGRILNVAMIALSAYSILLNRLGGATKGARFRGYWIFLASIFVCFDLFFLKLSKTGPLFMAFNNVQLALVPLLLYFVVRDLVASTGVAVRGLKEGYLAMAALTAAAVNVPGVLTYIDGTSVAVDLPFAIYYAVCIAGAVVPLVLFATWFSRKPAAGREKADHWTFLLLYVALMVAMAYDGIDPTLGAGPELIPKSVFCVFALSVYGIISNGFRFRAIDQKTRFLADHDDLTECFKRANGVARIEELIARRGQQPFSVVLVDFNNFKKINDLYGYLSGNHCLREVARRLGEGMPGGDMLCRTEGDEFLLIADGKHADPDTSPLLAKVFGPAAEPVMIGGNRLEISLRAGVSHYPEHGANASDLLKNADDCLVAAKRKFGRKFVAYDDEMRRNKIDFSRTELALKDVLDSPGGGDCFPLHYQPKVDRHGMVRGLEGLVRWKRGDEIVPPGRFISVAEKSGLINDIGRIVLEKGCRALKRWREERGCDLTISVNIAPRQVEDPALLDVLLGTIAAQGIEPSSLEIELTESTIMEQGEEERIAGFLSEVARHGIRSSIDDFGTGYSSFSRIVDLPVNVIKIDRSIAMLTDRDQKSRKVCRSLIQLAHELGMEVVAEGVDKEEQADFLFDEGCDFIQGFYFYRPLPESGIEGLIAEGTIPRARRLAPVR